MQIITPFQTSLLKTFVQVQDSQQFYFTGGTALSLFYLQHRKSEDLDFFTSTAGLIMPFTQLLEKKYSSLGYKVVLQRGFNSKDPGFDLYWLGVAFERLKIYERKDYDLSLVFERLNEADLRAFFDQWRKEIFKQIKP